MDPSRRSRRLSAASLLLLAACGGSVASTSHGPADGGVPDSGRGDAQRAEDGGCVANPTVGGVCTAGEQACEVGNPCCIGYVWQCSGDQWVQEGLGCACKVEPDSGPPDTGREKEVPTYHRPDDSQCATIPAAGDCPSGVPDIGTCTSDSQCTAGTNGRCNESGGGALECSCEYDACQHDTDCATGSVCACHGSEYAGGAGNTCLPGDCRVDSDCGAAGSGYCSPSRGGECGALGGYYCHTASDECVNDVDCEGSNGGPQICDYSPADKRWECTQNLLCG